MSVHLHYHSTAVAARVLHISSHNSQRLHPSHNQRIVGFVHAGRCLVVRTWQTPRLPDDLMCTHTLRLQWIMNLQHTVELPYQIPIRWRDDPCKSLTLRDMLSYPHYYYNVDGGYSGRPVRAALHDSRTRRLLAVSPECR